MSTPVPVVTEALVDEILTNEKARTRFYTALHLEVVAASYLQAMEAKTPLQAKHALGEYLGKMAQIEPKKETAAPGAGFSITIVTNGGEMQLTATPQPQIPPDPPKIIEGEVIDVTPTPDTPPELATAPTIVFPEAPVPQPRPKADRAPVEVVEAADGALDTLLDGLFDDDE